MLLLLSKSFSAYYTIRDGIGRCRVCIGPLRSHHRIGGTGRLHGNLSCTGSTVLHLLMWVGNSRVLTGERLRKMHGRSFPILPLHRVCNSCLTPQPYCPAFPQRRYWDLVVMPLHQLAVNRGLILTLEQGFEPGSFLPLSFVGHYFLPAFLHSPVRSSAAFLSSKTS